MISSNLAKVFFLLFIYLHHSNSCITDARCQDCRMYYISTGIGLFGYYSCDQCIQNRTLNAQTNICDCSSGYYDTGNINCTKCSSTCLTCSNSTICTSCDPNTNRVLDSGSCNCKDGYQQKYGNAICQEKANILMIVLSSVGSTLCMIFGFIICAFIRMRRGSQQIHAQTRKRKTNNIDGQIQMYYQQNTNTNGLANNSSHMYWNQKSMVFKSQEICSICLDPNPVFMTQCNHYFHSKCIYSWLSNKTTCPNCNKQIESKQVRRWCDRCKKVLMPVIMNITIKRPGGKKKKQIIKSTPIQYQYCDLCDSQSMSQDGQNININMMNSVNLNQKGIITNHDNRLVPENSQDQ